MRFKALGFKRATRHFSRQFPRPFSIIIGSITLLLLGVGVGGALPNRALSSAPAAMEVVAPAISYQGRLTNAAGAPRTGDFAMRFVIYDDPVAGSAVWDSGDVTVTVADGLFTVKLGVEPEDFNGQPLWLSIVVEEETLSPRQEILPAPYALSLRPGATMVDDGIVASGAILSGFAPATGTAFYGNAAGGAGLYGESTGNYGVWGASEESWGGYFTSAEGYGLRVETTGSDHFDHGVYVTAVGGYGVNAQSAQNQAVRGEAGVTTGIAQPLGAVGVVGIGANRGTYGSSSSGIGVYGVSNSNYGVWGQSTSWYGVTGRTGNANNNYGFYTPDNLFAANTTVMSAMTQVMQNNGPEPLSPGDVVVFNGVTQAASLDHAPIAQVRAATAAISVGMAGVVQSRFNLAALDAALDAPDIDALDIQALPEVTPAGDAAPGDYVLVVIQGLAQVNVSALDGESIQPGDLLTAGGDGGVAVKAAAVGAQGMDGPGPGAVVGKALESVIATQEKIYVYVTLR